MRRKDREITDLNDIPAMFARCLNITLSMCDDGRPYAVPLNFGVREEDGKLVIYAHCAKSGRKLSCIEKNPAVCVSCGRVLSIVDGDSACDMTAKYESVVGFGNAEVLSDGDALFDAGLHAVVSHYGEHPGDAFEKYRKATAVIRVVLDEVTGKSNCKA